MIYQNKTEQKKCKRTIKTAICNTQYRDGRLCTHGKGTGLPRSYNQMPTSDDTRRIPTYHRTT